MTHIEQMIKDMCPHGVEWKTIGDTLGVNRGRRLTKSELTEDGTFEVYHGSKDTPLGFYTKSNAPKDTVIIVNTGGIGGVKYLYKDFWCSDGSFWIGHSDVINNKFLYYFLSRYEDYFESQKRVGGVPTIDRKVVENFEIPIPPIEIQKKIVECLDKFSALAAELQAELQARRKQYEFYRTQLLTPPQNISPDGSTDERNWEWKKLGDVAELVTKQTGFDYSNTIKPALLDKPSEGTVPFLQTRNFSGRDFDYNTEYYVPNNIVEQFPRIVLDKECLLLSIVGASIGNVGLFPGTTRCFLGGAICVLKFKEGVNIPYIYEYLSSCYGQKLIRSKIKGAGQATITIEDIRNFTIPFPSPEKQERIATLLGRFGSLTSDISDGIPAEQAAQQKRYEYYRDKLLSFEKKGN